MDRHSEHSGSVVEEGGDVESLASRLSESKASSGPQTPAEPSEPGSAPEPGPEAETEGTEEVVTSEGGAGAASQQAENLEGPAAEPEAEEKEEALEELEEEKEDLEQAEEGKKEASSRASLELSSVHEEEAVSAPEAERDRLGEEEEKEKRASEEHEGMGGEDHLVKSEELQKPEGVDSEEFEWSEEVQKQQEQQLRSELLEQYRSLLVDRSRYQRYNLYLQHKIFEAIRKKKGLDAAEVPDKGVETESPEKEQQYLRYLATLEDLRKQEADDLEWYHQELGHLKQQCQEKLSRVEKEWRRFQALKKQVVMQAMGSCRMRGGRQAALREVEQIQALEDKKEKEIRAVRLENVQLRQSLVHFETRMRAQEDMTEGLLLIDFEQLKIENQTFNEKVEERNEELLKLRNKVTNNVQTVTHVKEKLHFMDMENAHKKAKLLEVEAQVALKRDILTKTKQARDSLRLDNIKLNQKCGLLGKESLLRDFEEQVAKNEMLRQRLESLKRHHAGLTLSCRETGKAPLLAELLRRWNDRRYSSWPGACQQDCYGPSTPSSPTAPHSPDEDAGQQGTVSEHPAGGEGGRALPVTAQSLGDEGTGSVHSVALRILLSCTHLREMAPDFGLTGKSPATMGGDRPQHLLLRLLRRFPRERREALASMAGVWQAQGCRLHKSQTQRLRPQKSMACDVARVAFEGGGILVSVSRLPKQ
ncbi:Coiled-coil domain-containing protein 96 [Tupaia chinensis]|uniref:Coiled-coil domain-containing protein 96 n=1 Tax=Tupaia chinensis TaxID=246437 RepID=L9KHM8_TUPCH|nr:Coiled-coil domain-containing protein 96 [Tupaia chinensis]